MSAGVDPILVDEIETAAALTNVAVIMAEDFIFKMRKDMRENDAKSRPSHWADCPSWEEFRVLMIFVDERAKIIAKAIAKIEKEATED